MFVLDKIAFDGLLPFSLNIDKGQCVGVSGESGCGKSRLLRAIADMDVHEGAASLAGVASDSMAASAWRTQVALLPAESQWWRDTVGEHFSEHVDFASLGFPDDVTDWDISRCSSGEKQRLSVLRCLANRPRVLLLDEPTANLDPDNTVRVEALIRAYLETEAASCIWVSHDRLQLQRVTQRHFDFSEGACVEVSL